MKIKLICFSILLFTFMNSYPQAKKTSDTKQFFYNVSLGSIIGLVGAIINKDPEQKLGNVLLKGFSQGALGGYITFESKRLVRVAEKNEDWKILWGSKILNAGGISIKENASLNKNFWEKWHINIGFNRIEFSTKDKFRLNYKVMPVALVYTIGAAIQTDFEFEKSLKAGQFIFSSNTERFINTNSRGIAYPGNIVVYTPFKNDFQLLSHEIIHIYQYNDFSQLETFLKKPINNLNSQIELINTLNNYINYDLGALPFWIIHKIEHNNADFYYDNFLEREAGFYSNTFRTN